MQNFIYTILVTSVQREEVVSLVFEVCNYRVAERLLAILSVQIQKEGILKLRQMERCTEFQPCSLD